MAFIAPFIATAIGLTGTAAVIGEAVIGIGLSVGASYLARRLQPKQASASPQGMRLSLAYDPNGPREIAFGTVASAGTRVYHQSYGPHGNDYIQLVFKLADVPCTSLEGMFVNGQEVTLGSSVSLADVSGRTVSQYPDVMWVEFHDGAWAQAADGDLVAKATGGEWNANFRGRGICYVRVTLKYDAEKYKDGLPKFLFVFKGAKLYDPRKDSTNGGSGAHRWGTESSYEWSANAALSLYNFMRGVNVNAKPVGGMSLPAGSLPSDIWIAAANAADENVALKAGGTEKRYRVNGIVSVATEHATVIRDMLGAMAGTLIDSGGVFKLQPGVAQASVMSFTDDDLMSRDDVRFIPKQSRSGLLNAVFGSFHNPEELYESVSLPPRISPADQASDGDTPLTETYGLPLVTSGTQGQRVLEIFRRRARYQRRVGLKLRARFAVLEAGDWVTWTSARYGFAAMVFEVVQSTLNRDLTVSVELKEVASSIYAWTAASDELDPLSPKKVGAGGSSLTSIAGLTLQNVTIAPAGSSQRPGLNLQWTPVTDKTVTHIRVEFRKVGDAAALETPLILSPSVGQYTWITGVQSGVVYEARALPVTRPVRPVTWTGWVQAASTSSNQVVPVAALATSVPPDTVTPVMLSPQARFEIGLTTATDDVLGSVAQQIAELQDQSNKHALATINALLDADDARTQIRIEKIERVAEDLVLAQQITTISAQISDTILAAIQEEQTARATADSALASDILSVVSRLGDNEVAVTVLSESLNGIEGKFGIAINANGQVVGLVQLDGSAVAGSTFTVVANNFKVAQPGVAGGAAVPMFAIQLVNGVSKLALRGDMFADGTITANKLVVATLSALSANLGTVTAGYIRDPANTYYWDLNNGKQGRTDGTFLIDQKNKILRITF